MDRDRNRARARLLAAALAVSAACVSQGGRVLPDARVADGRPDAPAPAPEPAADPAPDAAISTAPQDAGADATPDAAAVTRACRPPADLDHPIAMLTATGCVDPAQPLKPGAGLVFYDVASPLWSDGAEKERWVSIPPGKAVTVADDRDGGHFEFPEGTVLVKHFALAGKRIETRLITRGPAGWGTYSYRWNEQQTEATVIGVDEGAVAREVATQLWVYPSRTDCTKCHTEEAGFQLGLALAQLNTVVAYPDGTRVNQIDHWRMRGLFAGPPIAAPAALPAPTGTAGSLEARARSYLHANCANCHRPGMQDALMDLRWQTPFAGTETCNVAPVKGNLGVAGARRIVPGRPAASLISLRMHSLQERFRMPQIGTGVVDRAGAKVVDDWITSLTDCPQDR